MIRRGRLIAICLAAGTCLIPSLAWAQRCPQVTFPLPLNLTGISDDALDQRPRLVSDGGNVWLAVWQSTFDLGGSVGSDFDILVSRSTNNGASWSMPLVLNRTAEGDGAVDDLDPQVVTNGNGLWLAVWTSEVGGGDRDVLLARSTTNGLIWSPVVPLNNNAAGDSGDDLAPQLVTDGQGVWVAVWESDEPVAGSGNDVDVLFSRSVNSGSTWSPPQPLSNVAVADGSAADGGPQVATAGGTWIAVWHSEYNAGGELGGDDDIFFARSVDGGADWSAAQPLNDNAATDIGDDRAVQVVALGAGHWVAVWESDDELDQDLGTDRDLLYARSIDDGVTWSPAALLNSTGSGDGSAADRDPRLALTATGLVVAVWSSEASLGGEEGGPDTDVLFAFSEDRGQSWSDPQVLSTSDQLDPQANDVAADVAARGGLAMVAWQSDSDLGGAIGSDDDVLFVHLGWINCDDGDACTADACDGQGACTHQPLDCDDGNACTGEWCDPQSGCVFSLLPCGDDNVCTADGCDPGTGCTHSPLDCSDGNPCTEDSCAAGLGCAHAPVDCDDGDACTVDSCDPATGCAHASAACDDGDACTTDSCDVEAGCLHAAVDCADGDPCTTDTCLPASGCTHAPLNCSDGNWCNGVESCDPFKGCMGSPVEDCNLNGLEDFCDLSNGTSADCNGTDAPDECDIVAGDSEDENLDGIPDECQGCRGDLDDNGAVNALDLALLLAHWGETDPPLGDLTFDGQVNTADLAVILASFGPCPPACGNPTAGSCCAGNGTAFCDDNLCCTVVCVEDSFCCETEWDFICGMLAGRLCAICR